MISRFDEICEIAQQEEVIIDIDKRKSGVALISISKLQQIQEIEKSFRQLQRSLLVNRILGNAEHGGNWEDFLAAIDEGLGSDFVEQPADLLLTKIEAGVKISYLDKSN